MFNRVGNITLAAGAGAAFLAQGLTHNLFISVGAGLLSGLIGYMFASIPSDTLPRK